MCRCRCTCRALPSSAGLQACPRPAEGSRTAPRMNSRGKTPSPASAVDIRVDSASVNAGTRNRDGLGPIETLGRQSGSTRPDACEGVLPSGASHASSTRRRPRSPDRERGRVAFAPQHRVSFLRSVFTRSASKSFPKRVMNLTEQGRAPTHGDFGGFITVVISVHGDRSFEAHGARPDLGSGSGPAKAWHRPGVSPGVGR